MNQLLTKITSNKNHLFNPFSCTCTPMHMYTHMHTHKHTHKQANTHTQADTHKQADTQADTHTSRHTHKHTHTSTSTSTTTTGIIYPQLLQSILLEKSRTDYLLSCASK